MPAAPSGPTSAAQNRAVALTVRLSSAVLSVVAATDVFPASLPGELDVLFANRVSARKFEKTEADQFAGHGGTVIEKTE